MSGRMWGQIIIDEFCKSSAFIKEKEKGKETMKKTNLMGYIDNKPVPIAEITDVTSIVFSSNIVNSDSIVNYDYIIENGMAVTKIIWKDGSITICKTPIENADQYTGFMIAVAKYSMGNKNQATNAADYWIYKRPAQLAKAKERAKEQAKAEKAEAQRIARKRQKHREEHRLYLAAIRRKEAYEAAKLANRIYGVPLNFKEDGEDK